MHGRAKSAPKLELRYNSQTAKSIHTELISFIKDSSDDTLFLNRQLNAIFKKDPGSFIRVSTTGHTHLHDILHLPFEMRKDQSKAADKSVALLQLFTNLFVDEKTLTMSSAHIGCYKFLFLQQNADGFNPLHEAILTGNQKIISEYLHSLSKGLRNNCITNADIQTLFKAQLANSQNTALHLAARKNRYKILEILGDFIWDIQRTDAEEFIDELLAIKNKYDRAPNSTDEDCDAYLNNRLSHPEPVAAPVVAPEIETAATAVAAIAEPVAKEKLADAPAADAGTKEEAPAAKKANRKKRKKKKSATVELQDEKPSKGCPSLFALYGFFAQKIFGTQEVSVQPKQSPRNR